jgi:F-type H+-transporting ATPase subunit gamma
MLESLKFRNERPDRDVELVVFGKKLCDLMHSHHRPVSRKMLGFYQGMNYEKVAGLAAGYLKQYLAGEIAELWAVYTEFRTTARQKVRQEQILPIGAGRIPAEPQFPEYEYEPDPFAVLDQVLPMYYRREVWRVFLESAASEHIARMLAMDMATISAGEMIRDLTLSFNKARQETITRELSEISTAAEGFRN